MWFPAGPLGAPVSMRLRGICSSTVPKSYGYVLVQSSIKQTLLQSSFRTVTALRFRALRLPTWVSALLLTSLRSSRFVERPPLYRRRPRCSQPLDDFCNVACELVSSRSQVQDSFSSRGLSTSCSLRPSQAGCAHAVEYPHAHLQAGCHVRAPRLRRIVPHEAAGHWFGN